MRHALDAVIRGVTARNHGSGMPVFWLRWAKSVSVSDCQVRASGRWAALG